MWCNLELLVDPGSSSFFLCRMDFFPLLERKYRWHHANISLFPKKLYYTHVFIILKISISVSQFLDPWIKRQWRQATLNFWELMQLKSVQECNWTCLDIFWQGLYTPIMRDGFVMFPVHVGFPNFTARFGCPFIHSSHTQVVISRQIRNGSEWHWNSKPIWKLWQSASASRLEVKSGKLLFLKRTYRNNLRKDCLFFTRPKNISSIACSNFNMKYIPLLRLMGNKKNVPFGCLQF